MHYEGLIARMRKVYPFLGTTRIETIHGWGRSAYDTATDSIVIFFDSILEFSKTKRFEKRFGKHEDFEHAMTFVLLHEIHHVKQHKTGDRQLLYAEQRRLDDAESDEMHDSSWMEIECDEFARKEAPRWISKK